MSTKQVSVKLTDKELRYQMKVRSVELAIKSQGSKGCLSATIIKVAADIYKYISE